MRAFKFGLIMLLISFRSVIADSNSSRIISNAIPEVSTEHILTGLLIVVALIILASFVMKKILGFKNGSPTSLFIESGVSIGTREKLVLVNVEGRRILVGVSSGSIHTLYVVPEKISKNQTNSSMQSASTSHPEFSKWLQDIIKKDL